MKIAKFVMTLCFVCCALAAPVIADTKQYDQLVAKIAKLSEQNTNPVAQQLAIGFIEKNANRIIKKKQKQIRHLTRNLGWEDETAEIEKYQARISECQDEIKMYEDLLAQIQALKQ